jgi:hypothetical protein
MKIIINHILKLQIAIIIPYRDRHEHLITLLYYLHPILQRQQLDYKIYVTEQVTFILNLKKQIKQSFFSNYHLIL